ncbi:MAG: ABC transporter permease [Dehalococcoidia bacterium]|nr:ABC transporter permease [Dehalococcoidia bacterium]
MSEQGIIERVAVRPGMAQQLHRGAKGLLRFTRTQPLGTVGMAICVLALIMGTFAPWVARYDPNKGDSLERLQAPSAKYWFGTDALGRDLYSRIVAGARISLYVAFFSIAIGTAVGYLLGMVSGYLGGKVDLILERLVDAMLAFPAILLALALVSVLGAGLDKVILAISITFLPRAARVSRGVVLSVKENVYVDACRVIGASNLRIMLRHVLPNSLAPFLILASLALGTAILTEASLSYLGLGVPPPHASWGRELSGSAQSFALVAPWLMIFPGIAIMMVVLAFNVFGDSLRDVWDPRLRGS